MILVKVSQVMHWAVQETWRVRCVEEAASTHGQAFVCLGACLEAGLDIMIGGSFLAIKYTTNLVRGKESRLDAS